MSIAAVEALATKTESAVTMAPPALPVVAPPPVAPMETAPAAATVVVTSMLPKFAVAQCCGRAANGPDCYLSGYLVGDGDVFDCVSGFAAVAVRRGFPANREEHHFRSRDNSRNGVIGDRYISSQDLGLAAVASYAGPGRLAIGSKVDYRNAGGGKPTAIKC